MAGVFLVAEGWTADELSWLIRNGAQPVGQADPDGPQPRSTLDWTGSATDAAATVADSFNPHRKPGPHENAASRGGMQVRSLYLKALLPILLLVAAATLLVSIVGFVYTQRAATRIAREEALSLSATTKGDIERAMLLEHGSQALEMRRLLQRLGGRPSVVAVRLLSVEGIVRRSSRSHEVGTDRRDHANAQEIERSPLLQFFNPNSSSAPVVHTVGAITNKAQCQSCHNPAKAVIGLLDVDVNVGRQVVDLSAWRYLSAGLIAFQFLAILSLVSLVLLVLVVRPLRSLQRAMRRVRAAHMKPTGRIAVVEWVDTDPAALKWHDDLEILLSLEEATQLFATVGFEPIAEIEGFSLAGIRQWYLIFARADSMSGQ